jgi:starch phosphorylase
MYSWDEDVRNLFSTLDRELWERVGHSPRLFLRRVDQAMLDNAAQDALYQRKYNSCVSSYDTYMGYGASESVARAFDVDNGLIAYFCAEFGLHESFPIYSGGLGILAGDHCKAASDLRLPFVAVGLLYRQGYFSQTIDSDGGQHANYADLNFDQLAIFPARNDQDEEVYVEIDIGGRTVQIKVWQARAGRIAIYLLDTDIDDNDEADRRITHRLYGGDSNTRIQQEIVLGLGGVRALRRLGLAPTVWHINEGHAAFIILERCRELVAQGVDFETVLETVAGSTVFTTHTPVPAGHDIFSREQLAKYLGDLFAELNTDEDRLMNLGDSPGNEERFNQTALAIRGSRFRNGVSQLHGKVSSELCTFAWPEIPPNENGMDYVTNGVHVPTFLHPEWTRCFDRHLPSEWRDKLLDADYWKGISHISDSNFWTTHQTIKSLLIDEIKQRVRVRAERTDLSAAQMRRVTRYLNLDTLIIGFARRFATYKRATLLLRDLARLESLINSADMPVLFLFAGKAHPQDGPGQEFLRTIHSVSCRSEFEGRILLLEGYDIALARYLVSGVDVWLNTPEYPMEASGTSGQKAAINGVPNLSVLDGWWNEGYHGDNGWAISPHRPTVDREERDRQEADELFHLLEHEVLPLYYDREDQEFSAKWIRVAKRAMISALPEFSSQRMVMDYTRKFYAPAALNGEKLAANDYRLARELVKWRRSVNKHWPKFSMEMIEIPQDTVHSAEEFRVRVKVFHEGLQHSDFRVECLLHNGAAAAGHVAKTYPLKSAEAKSTGNSIYETGISLQECGGYELRIRAYPMNTNYPNQFECGKMLWL